MAPTGSPASPSATPKPLWRSRDQRVVAGVCGGLGEATGVDPLFYRVLAVVLTIFGGVGILLYALGWLLLPEGQGGTSVGERAINRASGDRTTPILLAVGLAIVAFLAAGAVFNHFPGTLLLLLALGGLWLLLRRDETPQPAGMAAFAGTASPPTAAPPTATGGAAGPPPSGEPPTAVWPPSPPAPPRERSILGRLTVSVLLIVIGGMAITDVTGADIPAAAYPAAALIVTGLGLLAGAWYGRSRGLIVLGLVAALALPPTAAADAWDVWGEGEWRGPDHQSLVAPADVGAVRDRYGFRPGRAELDLSGVDFAQRDRRVRVEMPAGELLVLLPPNVDVTVEADLVIGQTEILGRTDDGLGNSTRITDLGADGEGGGHLDLTIDQGAGHVEVRRAAS